MFAPPNSFLLLLYSPVKPTPEFWECCVDLVTIIGDIPFTSQNRHLSFQPHYNIFVWRKLCWKSFITTVTFKTIWVTNKFHVACLHMQGWLKTWIPVCPSGKRISHFACPGPLLAHLVSNIVRGWLACTLAHWASEQGSLKTWIPVCPSGKQISHFACPGSLLAHLVSNNYS